MEKYHNTVQDIAGNIIATATITIYNAGTLVAASIFEDDEITPLANPFTNANINYNDDGSFWFKAAGGDYDIKVAVGGSETIIEDVKLFDIVDDPHGSGGIWGGITGDIANQLDLVAALNAKADTGHTHNDLYYTEAEMDALLLGKANSVHSHDDLYYTESEINTLLSGKAPFVHAHDASYLRLDGSNSMTGAIDTTVGTITSSVVATDILPAFSLTSDQTIKGNIKKYLELHDATGAGFSVSQSGTNLYLSYDGSTSIFDSLIFQIQSALGTIAFQSTQHANTLGFNCGTNAVVSSGTSIALAGNAGGTNFAVFNASDWRPYTNNQTNLGTLSFKFKNGYFIDDVSAGTFNSVALTSAGSATQFLAGDGNYQTLLESDISDLQSYLLDITGESIGDLSDVSITGAVKGDIIVFNGTNWVDLSVGLDDQVLTADSLAVAGVAWKTSAGGGATTLDGLNDTSLTTPAIGEFLMYDGTDWINNPNMIYSEDVQGLLTDHATLNFSNAGAHAAATVNLVGQGSFGSFLFRDNTSTYSIGINPAFGYFDFAANVYGQATIRYDGSQVLVLGTGSVYHGSGGNLGTTAKPWGVIYTDGAFAVGGNTNEYEFRNGVTDISAAKDAFYFNANLIGGLTNADSRIVVLQNGDVDVLSFGISGDQHFAGAGAFNSGVAAGAGGTAFTFDTDNNLNPASSDKLVEVNNLGVNKAYIDAGGNVYHAGVLGLGVAPTDNYQLALNMPIDASATATETFNLIDCQTTIATVAKTAGTAYVNGISFSPINNISASGTASVELKSASFYSLNFKELNGGDHIGVYSAPQNLGVNAKSDRIIGFHCAGLGRADTESVGLLVEDMAGAGVTPLQEGVRVKAQAGATEIHGVTLLDDNLDVCFGAGRDVSMFYDGTDFIVDTNAATLGKLLSIKNNGVEKVAIDKDGNFTIAGSPTIKVNDYGSLFINSSVGSLQISPFTGIYATTNTTDTSIFTVNGVGFGISALTDSLFPNSTGEVSLGSANNEWDNIYLNDASSVIWSSNTTIHGTIAVDASNEFKQTSFVANGSTAVAHTLDTDVALSTLGAKLLSMQNNSVEKLSVDKDGGLTAQTARFNSEVANTGTGAQTVDFSAGQKQKFTITAATSITLSAPAGVGNYQLKLINAGTNITWVTTIKWAGGSAPTFTTTGEDIVSLYYDGTNWYAMAGIGFA